MFVPWPPADVALEKKELERSCEKDFWRVGTSQLPWLPAAIANRVTRDSCSLPQFFGIGGVAQVILGKGDYGMYLSINLAFGIGVTMGIHAAGGISGE